MLAHQRLSLIIWITVIAGVWVGRLGSWLKAYSLSCLVFEVHTSEIRVVYIHFANCLEKFSAIQSILSLYDFQIYILGWNDIRKLKKKFSYFSTLEYQNFNDVTEWWESSVNSFVDYIEYYCIIDADKQYSRGYFWVSHISFFHEFEWNITELIISYW
jgi:hypothetical protein